MNLQASERQGREWNRGVRRCQVLMRGGGGICREMLARFGVAATFYACSLRSVSPVSTVVHRQSHLEQRWISLASTSSIRVSASSSSLPSCLRRLSYSQSPLHTIAQTHSPRFLRCLLIPIAIHINPLCRHPRPIFSSHRSCHGQTSLVLVKNSCLGLRP